MKKPTAATTPEEAHAAMVEFGQSAAAADIESLHYEADQYLVKLLRGLGYGAAMDTYEVLPKWYA